jgi:hypothetical protein
MKDVHMTAGRMVVVTGYDKVVAALEIMEVLDHPHIIHTLECIETEEADDIFQGSSPVFSVFYGCIMRLGDGAVACSVGVRGYGPGDGR